METDVNDDDEDDDVVVKDVMVIRWLYELYDGYTSILSSPLLLLIRLDNTITTISGPELRILS